nr:uncharacterized protein LOC120963113 isoform X3 [Aegilops tauschii subsp. strangulata]
MYLLQDDAHVMSWLYNRVSLEIFGLVHQWNVTTAHIGSSIATLFLENAEHQVVFLATEFRRIDQSASSVISYFARLKECADRLADLGEPATDRDQRLLPNFLACRAFLLLEESYHAVHNDGPADMALHVARFPVPSGSGGSNSGRGGGNNRQYNNNNSGGGRYKGKGKVRAHSSGGGGHGSGRGHYNNTSSVAAPRAPTPSSAPWTGMVHAWAMPWRPHAPGTGILGARPGARSAFAGTVSHLPSGPPYGAPAPYDAPTWDQTALIHALNNMSLQQPVPPAPAGEWYLDTWATAHMASSSGTAHKEGDPPM